MTLPPDQRLISADDHMDIHVLPPDLWQERLPEALRDRGPRVVETDDGPWWEVEGRRVSPSGRKQAGYLNADQEVKIPIHAQLGSPPRTLQPRLGSWTMPAFVAIIPMQLDELLVGMIFSGILEQRPDVRLALGESGLGWAPYVMERMGHEHENAARVYGIE